VGNATALIKETIQKFLSARTRNGLEQAVLVRIRNVTHGSIKVVIADDHPLILQGLATLLSDEPDFRVIAACQDGMAALEAILKHSPDVALLDLRMPKMTGLDVLSKVLGQKTRIVILTAFADDDDVMEAINRGAYGIIMKVSGTSALLTSLRRVVAGYRSVPPELVKQEMPRLPEADSVRQSLTSREYEVMSLVANGLSNKIVAKQLKISVGTVKLHLHHIYCKIGISSRSTLAALVVRLRHIPVKSKLVIAKPNPAHEHLAARLGLQR
jgi:DNA-binding NarL/FixJ family response regulator